MMFPRAFVFLKPLRSKLTSQVFNCKGPTSTTKWKHNRFYHRTNVCQKGPGKKPGQKARLNGAFQFSDEKMRKGVLWATYGSFALGLSILSVIFYKKVILAVIRRGKGITDLQDNNCNKENMILYKGTVLPNFVDTKLKDIESFAVQDSDVWIVGYPRSGMMDSDSSSSIISLIRSILIELINNDLLY